MKEIEVLVRVTSGNQKDIIEQLDKKCNFIQKSEVVDTYYYDPLRKKLQPNDKMELFECLRLRKKGHKNYITYKIDNFDDNNHWLYSDENETEVTNLSEMKSIFKNMGLKKLVEVFMTKYFYENDDYIIAFEIVDGLGCFLEVESKKTNCEDVVSERETIMNFILSLNINVTGDVGIGKPEMLLKETGILE